MKELTVMSPAFRNNEFIPPEYTCDGANVSPPLHIEGIPKETQSLVLIMEDPDAPHGTFDHWVVWNIPPFGLIKEDSVPGVEGLNSAGKPSYMGPCPPSGVHRYFFKVYALDTKLDLGQTFGKKRVLEAMVGHVLAMGELVGRYTREKSHYDVYMPKEDELKDS
ncbi:Phosphatidylethanolamine-binding protein [uncultured archaeon]|nr:Phosphatidylethanolamine-binding protein [uncultured archaeon]